MRKNLFLLSLMFCMLALSSLVFAQTDMTWVIANFEQTVLGTQGFKNLGWGAGLVEVKRSTNVPTSGAAVMELVIDMSKAPKAAVGFESASVTGWDATGAAKVADTLFFDLYLPADAPDFTEIHTFAQDRNGWAWNDDKVVLANLQKGAWNTITFDLKTRAAAGIDYAKAGVNIGIEFFCADGNTYKGSFYIDNVRLHGTLCPKPNKGLTYVLVDFNLDALGLNDFKNTQWGACVKEVKRTKDKPAAGETVMEVVIDFSSGANGAIIRENTGVMGWDNNNNEAIAYSIEVDVWFPADMPPIGYMQLFAQDRTNWVWQSEDFDVNSIVKGQWNTLSFDVNKRLQTVDKWDISNKLQFGIQLAPPAAQAWTGSIYIDDVRLIGVKEPVSNVVLESPALTSSGIDSFKHATTGKMIYYQKINWDDLLSDMGESYNVYMSETGPITDVKAPGVITCAIKVPRGTKTWNQVITSKEPVMATRYYAVTATGLDKTTGLVVEKPVRAGISNTGAITCPSMLCYVIPFVENFDFSVDGDLAEFRAVAARFPRSELLAESPSGPAVDLAGWTPDSKDLNCKFYLVTNGSTLYIGAEVIDDDPTGAESAWRGDGFDVMGVLKDFAGATNFYFGENVPADGNGGFRLSYGINAATYETQLQKWGYASWTNTAGIDHNVDKTDTSYVVEIMVPFSTMTAEFGGGDFVAKDGMWLPMKIDLNDNDGSDDPAYTSELRTMQIHIGADPGNVVGWQRSEGWWPFYVTKTPLSTAVSQNNNIRSPYTTQLLGNYPNPFNPTTTVRYELAKAENVHIVVYDAIGREVATLVNCRQPMGQFMTTWNGRNNAGQTVGSGIYFVRMTSGDYSKTTKMMFLK